MPVDRVKLDESNMFNVRWFASHYTRALRPHQANETSKKASANIEDWNQGMRQVSTFLSETICKRVPVYTIETLVLCEYQNRRLKPTPERAPYPLIELRSLIVPFRWSGNIPRESTSPSDWDMLQARTILADRDNIDDSIKLTERNIGTDSDRFAVWSNRIGQYHVGWLN